jgi:WD40 repeat protein
MATTNEDKKDSDTSVGDKKTNGNGQEENKEAEKKEPTLEEKREAMSARAQRQAESRKRAAISKREKRWRNEGDARKLELAIMRQEDASSLIFEVRRRRTTLLNLVAARQKQNASNIRIRSIAQDQAKKVIGKQVDKGWYEGSHVYASSPNIISQFGSGEDGHIDSITNMAVDPSERFLYTVSRDNLIKVWNIDTATPVATYNGHKGAVTICKLLSVELPKCMQTYGKTENMAKQAQLGPHTSEIPSRRVGHRLFTAAQDFSVRKWDPKLRGWVTFNEALEIVKEAHHQIIHDLALSPNGEHLATCSADGTIVLWNMRRMLKIFTFVGHRDAVTSVCFSKDSDGQFLVSSSGATDATIKMWDTYVWERLSTTHEPKEYVRVHRGVYKGMIVSSGIKTVHHVSQTPLNLSPESMNEQKNIDRESGSESDSDEEAGGESDFATGGTQRVVGEGKRGQPPPIPETPAEEQFRLALERKLALEKAAAIAKERNRWNLFRKKRTGAQGDEKQGHMRSAIVPRYEDTDPIAARGGLIRTFAVRKTGEAFLGHTGWVNHVCFSNSGRRVASASCDHTIRLWNPKNGQRRAVLVGHTDWVMHCAFSSDDKTIISASADHSVRLWDVASRTPLHVLRGHRDTVNHCLILNSGRILSCGADKTIVYWQVAPLAPLPPPLVEVTHVNTDYFDVRWVVPSGMGRPLISYCIQLRGGYRAAMGLSAADVEMTPLEFAQGHEWGCDQAVSVRDHMKIEGKELIPGGLYQIRVAAISSVGQGGWSDPCRLVRLHATEPGRIDRPGIEAITSTTLSISWKQPRMLGARILHYRIQIQGGNHTFKSGKDVIVTSDDARKGAAYVLRLLKKQNKLEIDGMKEKDDMTDTEKRRLGVRRAIMKREMKKKRMALRETQKNAHVGEGGLVAHTVKKLRPGFQYNFRVCAVNRIGSGIWSRATYSTSTASIPPEICIPPRVHGNKQRGVQVSWKPPYDNGAKIVQYYLRYAEVPKEKPKTETPPPTKKNKNNSDDDSDDDSDVDQKKETKKEEKEEEVDVLINIKWTIKKLRSRQPWTTSVDFLEPATKYFFCLAAENDKGTSVYSEPTISATTATPPEAPANTLAVATASNKMNVYWPKPFDNGAPVRSYIIKRRAGGSKNSFGNEVVCIGALCKLKPPDVDDFGRPYGYAMLPDAIWLGTEMDGLRANTVYEFSIQGVNKYGVGLASYPTAEVPTHPPVKAEQMQPPVLYEQTPASCMIQWKEPPWDGGAEITTYRLRRDLNKDNNWGNERVVKAGDGESEVELPLKICLTDTRDRIQKGKRYRYQIAAVTSAGVSPWSEASNEMKIPTKMEFIVIANDRKKAKKIAAAEMAAKANAESLHTSTT